MQWTQYAVCSEIVVYGGGDIVFGVKKVKPVDTVDAVCSGHSAILIYGGGDIVFDAKRSNQWMQSQSGHSGCSTQWNSGIWRWGHCLWSKKCQTSGRSHTVDTVHSRHSGCSTQCMQYAVK